MYGRGLIRLHFFDYDRAMLDFEQAIRLDPNLAVAYSGRAFVNMRRTEYDQAIRDHGRALRLRPDGETYYNRGWCYSRKGDSESALRDFDQAIHLQPNLAQGYTARASIHFKRGQYDEAIRDYDRALRLRPNATDEYYRRCAYYQRGPFAALWDVVQALWHGLASLGRWIWALLVAAVWLIYTVRRQKAKQVDMNRTDLGDAARLGYDLELARRSLETGIETPPAASGEDRPELAAAETFAYEHDATLARALLESANIPTYLADERTGAAGGPWGSALTGFRLCVPAPFLNQARVLLHTRVSDEDLAAQAEASHHEDDSS